MDKETNGNGNGHARSVAIEIAKPTMAKAYEPQNYNEALQMAKTLAGSSLLGALKSPEAVFLVMATGAELGIPPTAALRSVHIVQGKPVLSSDLIVAVCLRSQLCEYFTCTKSTATEATYETKRKGSGPVANTFTINDAQNAGLAGKDNWKNYGKAMLRHRAAAELARMVYPDLVLGIYAEEEMIEAGPPASPNEQPRQQEVIDGEIVKEKQPERDPLTAVTWMFLDAKNKEDLVAARAAAAALDLAKDSDDYVALRALDKEAVERFK